MNVRKLMSQKSVLQVLKFLVDLQVLYNEKGIPRAKVLPNG